MRKRVRWWLLGLCLLPALAAATAQLRAEAPDEPWYMAPPGVRLPYLARGQDSDYTYEVPPVIFTGPFGHQRYETGGFFVGADFLYVKESNPLRSQLLAVRGFLDIDGSITGTPGTFSGSGAEALNVNQVNGGTGFTPGFDLYAGWRFESGVVVELSWRHLFDARQAASASTLPPGFNVGAELENTFLFSPVTNFPPDFAGAPNNLAVGNPGATYGIWNAAQTMQLNFVQRFDMGSVNTRIPIWQTDMFRNYALFGPRLVTMFERFTWRTVSADTNGLADPSTVAQYSNTISNRLYGLHIGCGNECYFGTTPVGGFSGTLDLEGGLYLDMAKGRARYETELRTIGASRARNMASIAPGAEARFGLWWYPWEAISLNVGYDFLAFFNTVASTHPVDFNMGSLNPEYNTGINRLFQGVRFGISFVF